MTATTCSPRAFILYATQAPTQPLLFASSPTALISARVPRFGCWSWCGLRGGRVLSGMAGHDTERLTSTRSDGYAELEKGRQPTAKGRRAYGQETQAHDRRCTGQRPGAMADPLLRPVRPPRPGGGNGQRWASLVVRRAA